MIKRKLKAAVRAEYRSGGAVYFIQKADFIKVGLSRDPLGRLRAIQGSSPPHPSNTFSLALVSVANGFYAKLEGRAGL